MIYRFSQFELNEGFGDSLKPKFFKVFNQLKRLKNRILDLNIPKQVFIEIGKKYKGNIFTRFGHFMADAKAGDAKILGAVDWVYQNRNQFNDVIEDSDLHEKFDYFRDSDEFKDYDPKKDRKHVRYALIFMIIAFIISLFINDPSIGIH